MAPDQYALTVVIRAATAWQDHMLVLTVVPVSLASALAVRWMAALLARHKQRLVGASEATRIWTQRVARRKSPLSWTIRDFGVLACLLG